MYARVLGDEICHKQSEARFAMSPSPRRALPAAAGSSSMTAPVVRWAQVGNLYELFHTRASLHQRARASTQHPPVLRK